MTGTSHIGQAPLRNVALLAQSERRFMLVDLARLIKERNGSHVHLYCGTNDKAAFYRDHDDGSVFDTITVHRRLMDRGDRRPDESAVIAQARRFEDTIGCTYNSIAVSDRHYGRGYSLLGSGHARSRFSEDSSYADMLHALNQDLGFWEAEIAAKNLDLIVGIDKAAARMAAAAGIPYRALAGSRYRNFHYFAVNEFFETPAVELRYRTLETRGSDGSAELVEPYLAHAKARTRYLRETSTAAMIKSATMTVARHAYWRLRGHQKGRGYYVRDDVRRLVRRWRELRLLSGPDMKRLDSIADQPFVFYGLQTEPEASLGLLSPEFFFQHAAIAATSRDLPVGTFLAVKEALFAVGRRPPEFYEQVSALKNVHFLDLRELGLDVVRRARAVVTVNGTVGFEAAALGKPVIALGRHNIFGFLPHVRVVTDLADLRPHLEWALDPAFDHAKAARDGARFLQAVVDTSFDLGEYDHFNLRDYDAAVVGAAHDALLASLGDTTGTAAVA